MRPKGSKNTDFFSRNGLRPVNTPGFPSGHMAAVSFFSTYLILERYSESNYKNLKEFIYNEKLFILFHLILLI